MPKRPTRSPSFRQKHSCLKRETGFAGKDRRCQGDTQIEICKKTARNKQPAKRPHQVFCSVLHLAALFRFVLRFLASISWPHRPSHRPSCRVRALTGAVGRTFFDHLEYHVVFRGHGTVAWQVLLYFGLLAHASLYLFALALLMLSSC